MGVVIDKLLHAVMANFFSAVSTRAYLRTSSGKITSMPKSSSFLARKLWSEEHLTSWSNNSIFPTTDSSTDTLRSLWTELLIKSTSLIFRSAPKNFSSRSFSSTFRWTWRNVRSQFASSSCRLKTPKTRSRRFDKPTLRRSPKTFRMSAARSRCSSTSRTSWWRPRTSTTGSWCGPPRPASTQLFIRTTWSVTFLKGHYLEPPSND